MMITYHIQIFASLMSYLTLKLTKTPILFPYGYLIVVKYASKRSKVIKELWEDVRGYRPLTMPRVLFIGVLLASTVNLLLLISLVEQLHIKCPLQRAELIARITPPVTLVTVPAVTIGGA